MLEIKINKKMDANLMDYDNMIDTLLLMKKENIIVAKNMILQ